MGEFGGNGVGNGCPIDASLPESEDIIPVRIFTSPATSLRKNRSRW
ncbi:hypothetical protein ABID21_004877 [Pseudorhizobium tarimense]|uniref:Uncharacterized protein n=1 Tax=Pseudorhizobium tarimense TaxID=1079109 RepID=A0ABV2HDZ2_9HYPH